MVEGQAKDKHRKAVLALIITDGRKVVGSAGTAEAISDTELVVDHIIITAETNNTGVITVGASTVVAAESTRRGTPLYAGESVTLVGVNLANVYLDTTVTGDGVTYIYFS